MSEHGHEPLAGAGSAKRRRSRALALVLAALAGLYLASPALLRGATRVLSVDDHAVPSDYLVMIAGDYNVRPRVVAELFRRGIAGKVLTAQVPISEATRRGFLPDLTTLQVRMLESEGVPADAIVRLQLGDGVTSTYDEARAVRAYLDGQGKAASVVLVTSELHTRRARWVFRRVLGERATDVRAVPVPHGTFQREFWWRHEDGLITVVNELAKLSLYLARY